MPVRNGQKYACESCIRGHRVSTCQHEDRPLRLIPPKGRPVKQCEHCRTARKSKSHHGKCDCGSKKEKKEKEKVEVKAEFDCCCHKGDNCKCGIRNEGTEARMERSLKRPTQPVKSKPPPLNSHSDSKLTHFANGHHKPVHRNNNLAHTSGAPYKVPRPHTLHGTSAFAKTEQDREFLDSIPRASDDMWLGQSYSRMLVSPPPFSRTNSEESLDTGDDNNANEPFSFDIDSHFATPRDEFRLSPNHLETVNEDDPSYALFESTGGMNRPSYMNLSLNTSPNFTSEFDASIFSPSDLPLVSPLVSDFTQSLSHSGDSNYQSIPGLSISSGTQDSECDAFNEALWNETALRLADNVAIGDSWASSSAETAPSVDIYLKNGQLASSDSQRMKTPQARHMSSSSAVTAINLSSSVDSDSDNSNAIVIPAAADSNDDAVEDWWEGDFSALPQASANSQMSRDLNWLF